MRRRPSAALVIAVLALLVAMTPPAVGAAQRLAARSVGTRELKDHAVTAAKLHANAVRGGNVVDGSLTRSDLAASARPRMPRSVYGSLGYIYLGNPAGQTLVSVVLPAGTWAVTAKGWAVTWDAGSATCELNDGTPLDHATVAPRPSARQGEGTVVLVARVTYTVPHTVVLSCLGQDAYVNDAKVLATEVA